ncbi:MAG: EpsG family protein [Clostridia bacterium]|nr:EpsG family protein [Clostridia bacterium]
MIIYYIVLIVILILGLLFYRNSEDWAKKLYLLLSFSGLFLLMAVRAETVGRDIHIYRDKFQIIATADTWKEIMEAVDNAWAYCLLNKAVSMFGDFRLMMIVTAFIILVSIAVYIYYFSDNVVISTYCFVVLFFYLHTYNLSRQFLAIALILLALCFRCRKRYILCGFLFLLAVGIHSTAIFALPLLVINRERITVKKMAIYMMAFTVLSILLTVGFSRVVSVFALIFPRYQFYLQGGEFSIYNQSSGAVVLLALFYLLVAAMAVVIQSNILNGIDLEFMDQSRMRYLIIAVTVGGMMGILSGSNQAMTRMLYFYQIHTICLIPNAFGKLQQYRFYYPLYYGLLLLLLVPFTICLLRNFGYVVPYISLWQ